MPDPVNGSAARAAARRELERSEYHHDDPGLVQRVLDWVGNHISSLFDGGAGSNTMLLLLLLVAGVIVVLAVRAGRPAFRRRRAGSGAAGDTDVDLLASADSRTHRRAAARFDAEGRHAEALREWLRAAIATVEERGVLAPRPGRTGAATAREAGPALPSAAGELSEAMTSFEQVWFGAREATAEDVARARTAADAVAAARITAADATTADLARW